MQSIAPNSQNERSPRSVFRFLSRPFFVAGYVVLLLWFHGVDVYHRHFATTGPLVVVHNLFRVLFIFYLFWMVHAAGAALLRLVARQEFEQLGLIEGLALGFFAGTGVWHVAMLALGYLNLYTMPVAAVVTVPVVAAAYGNVAAAARGLCSAISQGAALRRNLGGGKFMLSGWLVFALAVVAFLLLLLVKGLYPGGGHDYFTHYFYYYQTVIDRGGLWPNEVWYHYYYSKGAGLYFLAMLATDPLAPQLVTFCFIAAAALALFLFLRKIAPATLWPLIGTALFLTLYISTPGSTSWFRSQGGWGDFEKLHELNAALVIASLWMSSCALELTGRRRLLWWIGAASAIIAAVIINITVAVFFGAVFGLLMAWSLFGRDFRRCFASAGLAFVAASVLVLTLIVNYLTTGLAEDQGLLLFWKFADLDRLNHGGALAPVMIQHHGLIGMAAASLPIGFQLLRLPIESSRAEMLLPLVLGGVILAIPAFAYLPRIRALAVPFVILAASTIVFIGLTITVGRMQPISFYRYASFQMAITISSGILLWAIAGAHSDGLLSRLARNTWVSFICLVACLLSAVDLTLARTHLGHAVNFAIGKYSIDRAYETQFGPPPRQQWTAIYPGSRAAHEIVGPNTPIWSMHIHLYCMLPNCRVESYPSFIMTPRWDRVMFGTPAQGREALKSANVNYFLFTREDQIADPLPLSPLFRPDDIGKYLGIRWTDGTTTLLTWLGPDTTPIDDAWLEAYRKAVAESGTVNSFPYDAMKGIFLRLDATPHPWHSFPLPWERK